MSVLATDCTYLYMSVPLNLRRSNLPFIRPFIYSSIHSSVHQPTHRLVYLIPNFVPCILPAFICFLFWCSILTFVIIIVECNNRHQRKSWLEGGLFPSYWTRSIVCNTGVGRTNDAIDLGTDRKPKIGIILHFDWMQVNCNAYRTDKVMTKLLFHNLKIWQFECINKLQVGVECSR